MMMNTIIRAAPALLLGLLLAMPPAAPADAAGDPALRQGGKGQVRAIIDGDTLVLATGDRVRLVGIQAPKLPLGRRGFRPWPLAAEAKAALAALTLGKTVTLSYGGRRVDRHGRLLAHVHDAQGRWIQGEMLRRGLARVDSFADNRARIAEMQRIEGAARAARRGIWRLPFYGVRRVTETPQFVNSFQLVQGRIRAVATVRGTTYLNFGRDWRTDFTIAITGKARRLFAKAGIDLAALAGRRIRVRGWLKSRNGPMIVVTHPEQIERLAKRRARREP